MLMLKRSERDLLAQTGQPFGERSTLSIQCASLHGPWCACHALLYNSTASGHLCSDMCIHVQVVDANCGIRCMLHVVFACMYL